MFTVKSNTIAIDDKIAQTWEKRRERWVAWAVEGYWTKKHPFLFTLLPNKVNLWEGRAAKFEPWDAYFLCHFMWDSKWWKSAVISSFLQNFTENWILIPSPYCSIWEATPHTSAWAHAVIQFKCRLFWVLSRHQIKTPDKKLPIQMFLALCPSLLAI